MSRTTNFSHLRGIARIDWILKTETPLVIKSGTISEYEKNTNEVKFTKKSIGGNTDASVADFYFTLYFDLNSHNMPRAVFRIPSSSIRGNLRIYSIKRLVEKKLWKATQTPDKSDESEQTITTSEYKEKIKKVLNDPGFHLIQNLFGMATENENVLLRDEGVAGRLQVICDDHILPVEEMIKTGSLFTVVSRNPLDRVTRGSKSGGLHNFMELNPGFEFKVVLRIINPVPEDLGFIDFWERSIDQGLIRLGGLRSIGKGRISVKSSEVTLFSRNTDGFVVLGESNSKGEKATPNDILEELYPYKKLDWSKKPKSDYLKCLNKKFKNYTRR